MRRSGRRPTDDDRDPDWPDDDATPRRRPTPTAPSHVLGLRCRACGRPEEIGPNYVCAGCFGPLEVVYDLDVARRTLTREAIAARAPGIWRYLELLPVSTAPARGLAVGSTALVPADRLGEQIGIDRLWLKDDTRNPTLQLQGPRRRGRRGTRRRVRVRHARLRLDRQPGRRNRGRRGRPRAARLRLRPVGPRAREGRPRRSATARRSSASTARTTTSTASASRSPTRRAGPSST